MPDIIIYFINGKFQGFVPKQAVWRGPPSKERIAQILREYVRGDDGWIYHCAPGQRPTRWCRWR